MDFLTEIVSVSGNLTLVAFMLWRVMKQDSELDMYRQWFVRRQERRDDEIILRTNSVPGSTDS